MEVLRDNDQSLWDSNNAFKYTKYFGNGGVTEKEKSRKINERNPENRYECPKQLSMCQMCVPVENDHQNIRIVHVALYCETYFLLCVMSSNCEYL